MRILIILLKILGGLLFLLISTVIALRFTLDLEEIKPKLEAMLGQMTESEAKIDQLSLQGITGLGIDSVEFTFPLTPEQEAEWSAFRAYLKEKRRIKREGGVAPEPMTAPAEAIKLCAQKINFQMTPTSLISFALGGEISGEIEARILTCGAGSEPLSEDEPKRLSAHFQTIWETGSSTRTHDIQLRGISLNEVDLADIGFLKSKLPIEVSGQVMMRGEATLTFDRRWRLLINKSTGKLKVEASRVSTKKGLVGLFELPDLNFGQITAKLEVEKNKLNISEFQIRNDDFTGDLTGFLQLSGVWGRTGLNLHLAFNLSPEFVSKTPEISRLGEMKIGPAARYLSGRADKGYDVGVLLKGRVNRPQASPAKNSPYSKEGRTQERRGKRETTRSPRIQDKKRGGIRPGLKPNLPSSRPPRVSPVRRTPVSSAKGERAKRGEKRRTEVLQKPGRYPSPASEKKEISEDGETEVETEVEGEYEGESDVEGEHEGESDVEGVHEGAGIEHAEVEE